MSGIPCVCLCVCVSPPACQTVSPLVWSVSLSVYLVRHSHGGPALHMQFIPHEKRQVKQSRQSRRKVTAQNTELALQWQRELRVSLSKKCFGFLTWSTLTCANITLYSALLRALSSHSGLLQKCYRAANELISSQGLLQSQVQDIFQQQFKQTMFRKDGRSIHNFSRLHRAIPFWGLCLSSQHAVYQKENEGGGRRPKAKAQRGTPIIQAHQGSPHYSMLCIV